MRPVGFARGRLGACHGIASYQQGGRALSSLTLLAKNKRRSERSSPCAARAALDIRAAATLKPYTSYLVKLPVSPCSAIDQTSSADPSPAPGALGGMYQGAY